MSGEEETTCVELTALEQINESQQSNGQQSFATASNDKTGTDKGSNRKWRWFKLRPRHAGSVLDEGKNPLNKYWQYLKIAVLSTVVVVVLVLMLLPTIFYHLPLPITADGSQSNTSMEMGNQSNTSMEMGNQSNTSMEMGNQSNMSGVDTCSEQLARTDAVNCSSGVVYALPACQENLLSLQGCLPDRLNSRDVYISVTDQVSVEAQARQLLTGLESLNPSTDCRVAVQPFLCLYLFGLCDSHGTAYLPTFEECVRISTDVCESEWGDANRLLSFLGLPSLPECTSFPSTVSAISGSGSSGEGETAMPPPLPSAGSGSSREGETAVQPTLTSAGMTGQVNCSTLQCQEGFSCSTMRNTSLCLPVCGSWEEYSRGVVVAVDVVVIMSAAIGLISSIAVLVITCIRWKRMLTFPSVFVVYMTVSLLVISVFVLITYTDRTSLYCSSEYLFTLEMGQAQRIGPTAFCTLAGIVFYYCLFQLTAWWFCHVVSLFWKIQFPFHARSFETAHRIKYIHITMVIVGVVLPTLPVIVAFTAGDPSTRGFGLTRFPPILCTSLQANPTFYSLVLPINILIAIGVPLLIIIFWIIHKKHGLFRIKLSKHPFKIGTAERKILIIFCYYVLLGAIALTSFTISTRDGRLFANAIAEYWRCEITGVNPENSCDGLIDSFRQLSYPGLTAVSIALLGIFPAVNLIFAVNVREIKQKFNVWCGQAAVSYPSDERSTASTNTTVSALNKD